MPATTAKPTTTPVRWQIPAALALAPLVLGILVSFSADHSARYGLAVLTIFAGVTAAAGVVGAFLLPAGNARIGSIGKAVVGVLGAVAAGIAAALVGTADLPAAAATIAWTAAVVLALFAVIDIWLGVRRRREDRFARDWLTLGVLEGLTAIVLVIVPSGYDYHYTVTDATLPPAHLELDAAVIIVGLLGAALAVIGVYLAIAAVSLMSGRKREQVTA